MNKGTLITVVPIFIAMFSTACTIAETPAPMLMGPSELALSLAVTVDRGAIQNSTDTQPSTATIEVFARDENGQPKRDVTLRVDIVDQLGSDTIVEDRGTLSASTITTGANGRAPVIFTAPIDFTPGLDDTNPVIIRVRPIAGDFASTVPRFLSIRILPPTVVVVPGAPTAVISAPASAAVGAVVPFDGSASFDSDGSIVSYEWNWADGSFGNRPVDEHDWTTAGTKFVTLTVTDNEGKTHTATHQIVIN